MDNIFIIVCSACLLYFGYHFIIAWFKPKRVLEIYKRTKRKGKSIFRFLPPEFFDAIFGFNNPIKQIWWYRIGTTFAVLIMVFALIMTVLKV
jgi:hypothetical protein